MTAPFSSAEDSFPVGSTIVEKYRVERTLGAGGMGAVLEVTHVTLGHRVALKVLHPGAVGVGDAIPRFLREARATAALESEHVVRIFDIGTTPEGMPFLVMERLTGIDLDELLSQIGPLPVGLALECLYQATQGVREAHAAGIIHRDLKPSNLFLGKRADGRPLIKVLDFGISKLQQDEGQDLRLTETRTIVGSPQYMSPEQVRDARTVSARSDIWALGAILHELLQGKPAFTGDTLPSVCAAIVTDEPAHLTREEIPEEVDRLRLRCLVKNPAERIASADELLEELEILRAFYPAPPLEELSIVFPERSGRQSALSSGKSASPAVYSHATVVDSRDTFMNPKETSSVRDVVATSHTLTSGTLSARTHDATRRRRFVLLGAVALLAVGGVSGVLFLQSSPEPAATPAPLPPEPRPVLTLLDISSAPEGALVVENGRVLGRTPTSLEISFAERPTRELELRLDGYHPHLLTVSEQILGRPIEVQLIPLPAEKGVKAEEPSSTEPAQAVPIKAAHPALSKRPTPRPSPVVAQEKPPEPDIRMSR